MEGLDGDSEGILDQFLRLLANPPPLPPRTRVLGVRKVLFGAVLYLGGLPPPSHPIPVSFRKSLAL